MTDSLHVPPPLERSSNRLKAAFTLVEIAILLVIIGLIVGGIMVGADLIRVAPIRKQIRQMEDVETQINAFQVKYGCLPGDCPFVTTYFSTPDVNGYTIANGDGNGMILSSLSTYISGDCNSAPAT